MSTAKKLNLEMSAADYLVWERTQTERHEYFAGEVFSQAGGTRKHSLIGSNVLGEIQHVLKGRDCQAHGSDMKIHVEATGYFAYPDVSVVCPPIQGDSDDVIANPILIVEVLSPSTADFDRGTKFDHYRQIPSLQEYLIFSQDEPHVEQRTRTDEGSWLLRMFTGIDQLLTIASLKTTLALRDAHQKVDFS